VFLIGGFPCIFLSRQLCFFLCRSWQIIRECAALKRELICTEQLQEQDKRLIGDEMKQLHFFITESCARVPPMLSRRNWCYCGCRVVLWPPFFSRFFFYEARSSSFCADFVPMGYIEPEDVVPVLSSADSIGLLADVVEAPFGLWVVCAYFADQHALNAKHFTKWEESYARLNRCR
jgi:hypothetical protein